MNGRELRAVKRIGGFFQGVIICNVLTIAGRLCIICSNRSVYEDAALFIYQPVPHGRRSCTFREAGELQAEIGKLTHPARPDVDWGRVESLSLALFRQNGVELQTLVCYALARTRQYGIAGMVDALDALAALINQRWGDFWPLQVHSRIALLAWLAEKMKQALRTQDLQYQDLAQINHCSQHLTEIENVLRRCEVWHMSKLEQLAVQLRNAAMRLERPAPQGEKRRRRKSPERPGREM